ncbi:MAG: heavy metal translocating P-type ATPase [Myxococcales bacterium]|nr:heavy metal translocating P-type ATPase [Myxococcales bacterium]
MTTNARVTTPPMWAPSTSDAGGTRGAGENPCAHCGQPAPAGTTWCCSGCETVAQLLAESGLEDRYAELAGDLARTPTQSGRTYEEFDSQAFSESYVTSGPTGVRTLRLSLSGVHCTACLWLVESLPRLLPGMVLEARLELRRQQVFLRLPAAPGGAPPGLATIARTLDTLGYPVTAIAKGASAGLDARDQDDRALLVRIGVAGAATMNVMLISVALYSGLFGGMDEAHTAFFRWASLIIGLPGTLWPGAVFLKGARNALFHPSFAGRRLHVDLPIAIGLLAGSLWGAVNTIRGTGELYFDTLTTLVFLLLIGRYLSRRWEKRALDAAARLLTLTPSAARRVMGDGLTEMVLAEALRIGDRVEVRSGETIPCDGVLAGSPFPVPGEPAGTDLDLAMLSGESVPVATHVGDPVYAGSTCLTRPIIVSVSASGEATRMGRLLSDIEALTTRRAPAVTLADRWAARFVKIVLVVAALTFIGTIAFSAGGVDDAVERVVALLVVTCPCALALATPLALTVAIGRAARSGLLVRGGDALEAAAEPGRIYLDKTGTLTTGTLTLARHVEFGRPIGPFVASLEATSAHPVGRALLAGLVSDDKGLCAITDVTTTIGGGLEGRIGDGGTTRIVKVGSPAFIGAMPDAVREAVTRVTSEGYTPVIASAGAPGASAGAPGAAPTDFAVYGLGDTLRPEAPALIASLRRRGFRIGILSGDHVAIVRGVGERLGLPAEECHGGLSPEAKREHVARARAEGPVIMVGDGVNDAAALAAATVGLAVHGGAEASLLAADAFSSLPGLQPLRVLVDTARSATRAITRNLRISASYNLIGGSLAVLGFMHPLVAAVLMPLSSLTVITSSFRAGPKDGDTPPGGPR